MIGGLPTILIGLLISMPISRTYKKQYINVTIGDFGNNMK